MKKWIELFCLTAIITLGTVGQPAIANAQSAEMTVLITGANRGIGLEFARQYTDLGYRVIGTARDPAKAKELKALGVQVEALDVTDSTSVNALARKLDGTALDILINNAGIYGHNADSFLESDFDQLNQTFEVNTLGPMRVTQAFYESVKSGPTKKIVHISSTMGSITNNNGGSYGYRASKAALNMLNKSLSIELASDGFICTVLHPGWVKTRMGGEGAALTTQQSVAGMLNVIAAMDSDTNGQFLDYQGQQIPW